MFNNLIKPVTNNKTGKVTFYIFEITAAALAFLTFISSIVMAAITKSFMTFLEYFLIAVFVFLLVYALGRIIDLNFANTEKKCNCGDDCDCNKD